MSASRHNVLWPEPLNDDTPSPERILQQLDEMSRRATPQFVDQTQMGITRGQVARASIYFEHLNCSRPLRGNRDHYKSKVYENLEFSRPTRS